jgi:hypothetical protein
MAGLEVRKIDLDYYFFFKKEGKTRLNPRIQRAFQTRKK